MVSIRPIENSKGIFIFDIDGTLSDPEHRRHHVMPKLGSSDKDWKSFNAEMINDPVNVGVTETFKALQATGNFIMYVCTARTETNLYDTLMWLDEHNITYKELMMRTEEEQKQGIPDYIVKKGMLDKIIEENPDVPIIGVFDDRKSVVNMWIENGLFVFDVGQNQGDF